MAKRDSGQKSFKGAFALHMLDLLGGIKSSKQTLLLRVGFASGEEGMIFFDKGKLVHAEFMLMTGEEAFAGILQGKDGTYASLRGINADVISIERDARELMDEYTEGAGEKKPFTRKPKEKAPEKKDAAIEQAGAAEWSPPPPPEQGLQEESWIKDWGGHTPGFVSAQVVGTKGDVIMKIGEEGVDLTALGMILDAAALLTGTAKPVEVKTISAETADVVCMVSLLAEGYYLVVRLDAARVKSDAIQSHLNLLVTALNQSLARA